MVRTALALLALGFGLAIVGFVLGYFESSTMVEVSSMTLLVAVAVVCGLPSFGLLVTIGVRSLRSPR